MKSTIYKPLFASVLLLAALACGDDDNQNNNLNYGTVSDSEGNTYKTIAIGTQEWMAENLRSTKFSNGDPIPHIPDIISWEDLESPGYCVYDNDPSMDAVYGKLYNMHAMIDQRNPCPSGWHVPTDEDWLTLRTFLDTENTDNLNKAGGKMKTKGTEHWKSPNTGASNQSGYSALAAGVRTWTGQFADKTHFGYFWSSTADGPSSGFGYHLEYNSERLIRMGFNGKNGFSCRCVKD